VVAGANDGREIMPCVGEFAVGKRRRPAEQRIGDESMVDRCVKRVWRPKVPSSSRMEVEKWKGRKANGESAEAESRVLEVKTRSGRRSVMMSAPGQTRSNEVDETKRRRGGN